MLQFRVKNPERKIDPRGCIQVDTVGEILYFYSISKMDTFIRFAYIYWFFQKNQKAKFIQNPTLFDTPE